MKKEYTYEKLQSFIENKRKIEQKNRGKAILENRKRENEIKLNDLKLKNKKSIDEYIERSNKNFEAFINKLGSTLNDETI